MRLALAGGGRAYVSLPFREQLHVVARLDNCSLLDTTTSRQLSIVYCVSLYFAACSGEPRSAVLGLGNTVPRFVIILFSYSTPELVRSHIASGQV